MNAVAPPWNPSSNEPGSEPRSVVPASVIADSPAPREGHDFIGDLEDLVDKTSWITGGDLALAKARLGKRIARARRAVAETRGALVERTRRNAVIANRYVHARPWAMVGVAVAVGGLIGLMFGRSR